MTNKNSGKNKCKKKSKNIYYVMSPNINKLISPNRSKCGYVISEDDFNTLKYNPLIENDPVSKKIYSKCLDLLYTKKTLESPLPDNQLYNPFKINNHLNIKAKSQVKRVQKDWKPLKPNLTEFQKFKNSFKVLDFKSYKRFIKSINKLNRNLAEEDKRLLELKNAGKAIKKGDFKRVALLYARVYILEIIRQQFILWTEFAPKVIAPTIGALIKVATANYIGAAIDLAKIGVLMAKAFVRLIRDSFKPNSPLPGVVHPGFLSSGLGTLLIYIPVAIAGIITNYFRSNRRELARKSKKIGKNRKSKKAEETASLVAFDALTFTDDVPDIPIKKIGSELNYANENISKPISGSLIQQWQLNNLLNKNFYYYSTLGLNNGYLCLLSRKNYNTICSMLGIQKTIFKNLINQEIFMKKRLIHNNEELYHYKTFNLENYYKYVNDDYKIKYNYQLGLKIKSPIGDIKDQFNKFKTNIGSIKFSSYKALVNSIKKLNNDLSDEERRLLDIRNSGKALTNGDFLKRTLLFLRVLILESIRQGGILFRDFLIPAAPLLITFTIKLITANFVGATIDTVRILIIAAKYTVKLFKDVYRKENPIPGTVLIFGVPNGNSVFLILPLLLKSLIARFIDSTIKKSKIDGTFFFKTLFGKPVFQINPIEQIINLFGTSDGNFDNSNSNLESKIKGDGLSSKPFEENNNLIQSKLLLNKLNQAHKNYKSLEFDTIKPMDILNINMNLFSNMENLVCKAINSLDSPKSILIINDSKLNSAEILLHCKSNIKISYVFDFKLRLSGDDMNEIKYTMSFDYLNYLKRKSNEYDVKGHINLVDLNHILCNSKAKLTKNNKIISLFNNFKSLTDKRDHQKKKLSLLVKLADELGLMFYNPNILFLYYLL